MMNSTKGIELDKNRKVVYVELKSATLYISYHLDVYKIENTKLIIDMSMVMSIVKNKPQQKNYFPK